MPATCLWWRLSMPVYQGNIRSWLHIGEANTATSTQSKPILATTALA
jgi:hypothetical protein